MKNIVIIGAGPRGLAMALRALQYKDYKVFLVDENPCSTWKAPNMIADMQMRSPITFDLTTFQEDLYDKYSLAKFLKHKEVSFTDSQQEVESNDIFCHRKEFVKYLNYIIYYLKKEGVIFCQHRCINVDDKYVTLSDSLTEIEYDYLVFALGSRVENEVKPGYLAQDRLLHIKDLFNNSWFKKDCSVIGSGQNAAEICYFLAAQKARVNWIRNKVPKVNQYPVPSWKEWGAASALGPYYRGKYIDKAQYMKRVKLWMPTITPYISEKLSTVNINYLEPSSTCDINMDCNFFIAAGRKQEVTLLPISIDIKRDTTDPLLPDIVESFKSTSHPNIYFTGLLAKKYDGPRQGSIISSGLTANTIMNSILNDA